jgi:hypothetical protein
MSQTGTLDMIGRRSELLATVVLTRRLNIDVHSFGTSDDSPDLICTIRPDPEEKIHGFLPFGVFVWGTAKELASEEEATRFARSRQAKIRKDTFLMPVIVLLFSMKKDEAYFAWLVEPCKDSAKLMHLTDLDFTLFDGKQLDRMISRIKKWFQRMQTTILADAGEIASSRSRGDGA